MEKILIIRPNAIGDFILWLPYAKQYRQCFPIGKYKIVLLANNQFSEWARRLDYWDEVIDLDRVRFQQDFSYAWNLLSQVRQNKFDKVFYPVFSREFLFGDLFVLFSRAKDRIGFSGNLANRLYFAKLLGDMFFTELLSYDEQNCMWEGHKNKFFINNVFPTLEGSLINVDFPKELIGEYNLSVSSKYIVLFIGAGAVIREWPIHAFIEIAQYITKELKLKVVILGSLKDSEKANLIVSYVPEAIDLTGKTTLAELSVIIKNASLVIGNESAGIHLAASLKTRSICILGGGHFKRFVPYPKDYTNAPHIINYPMGCYNCNWDCQFLLNKLESAPCISNITFQQVKEAIERIIK